MKIASVLKKELYVQKKDLLILKKDNPWINIENVLNAKDDDFIFVEDEEIYSAVLNAFYIAEYKNLKDINIIKIIRLKWYIYFNILILNLKNKLIKTCELEYLLNYYDDLYNILMYKISNYDFEFPTDVLYDYPLKVTYNNDLVFFIINSYDPNCFYIRKEDESPFFEDEEYIVNKYILNMVKNNLKNDGTLYVMDTNAIESYCYCSDERNELRIEIKIKAINVRTRGNYESK